MQNLNYTLNSTIVTLEEYMLETDCTLQDIAFYYNTHNIPYFVRTVITCNSCDNYMQRFFAPVLNNNYTLAIQQCAYYCMQDYIAHLQAQH